MRNYIFIILLLTTTTSCINKDTLNINKFDNLVLTPNILLPFVQVELSDDYYQSIIDDQSITESEVLMLIDTFKEIDISEYVVSIDFNFTAINGYPINFDHMTIYFLDEYGNDIESLVLEDIKSGQLNDDGSLKSATKNEYSRSLNSISPLMNTRAIRVVISWKGNPVPFASHDSSFYFETFSDMTLITNINK